MALVVIDRAKETTTTTGTGTVTLLGAVTGFQSLAGVGNTNTTFYCIADQVGNNWEVGIGTYSTTGPTLARTDVLTSSNGGLQVAFTSGTKDVFVTLPSTQAVYAGASGDVNITTKLGMGVLAPTAFLEIQPGDGNTAPIKLTGGVNLGALEAGAIEYDIETLAFTNNTLTGRGYVPSIQTWRLVVNGTAFGPTIGNFFGVNSAIILESDRKYEIEAYCYFLKTTAGTVTVTATTSFAPQALSGVVQYGALAGGTATGAANQITLVNSTSTGAAFGASGSLTTAVNHLFIIKLIVDSSFTNASNLRINFTTSAGTITPLRNSYYKVTKTPQGVEGNFVT